MVHDWQETALSWPTPFGCAMMTAFVRRGLLSVLALVASGCSLVEPTSCSAIYVSGLTIVVKDSISTAGIASGAHALARDGTFVDSVSVPENLASA